MGSVKKAVYRVLPIWVAVLALGLSIYAATADPVKGPTDHSPNEAARPAYPAAIDAANGPPKRSTFFSGAGRLVYAHNGRFESGGAMTIEAWVYRRDEVGCETIVDHRLGLSYWFGTCPRPRFYRASGQAAEATAQVYADRWTHVAVSYDGTTATFYINGELVGSSALAMGSLLANELSIGGTATGNYLNGYLDEVRLWSVARTQEQIRAGMYQELRSGQGLAATFGDGGSHEDMQNITGTLGSGISLQTAGMLPRDLVVPRAPITPTLNGSIELNFEYAGAEQIPIRHALTGPSIGGSQPIIKRDWYAYLVRTETDLYIGIPSVWLFANDWDTEKSWIGVSLDPDFTRDAQTQPGQIRFQIWLSSTQASASAVQVGDGAGNFVPCSVACPALGVDWDVRKGMNGDDVGPLNQSVEIRIAKSLLGEWTEVDGLAIGQFNVGTPARDYLAPSDAQAASPATWAIVSYGDGSAALPRVRVSGRLFNSLAPGGPPFANHKVYFGSIGTVMYERMTDSEGRFSFDARAPINAPLTLQPADCTFCKPGKAQVSSSGIQPVAVGGSVFYPSCNASSCTYANADLFMMTPPGATSLAQPPSVPVAVMQLNTQSGSHTPDTTVLLRGANLHDLLEIYLSPDTFNTNQNSWVLYRANIISRSQDMTTMMLQVPVLPRATRVTTPTGNIASTLDIEWRWVIKDNWVRSDWSDAFRSDAFRLSHPAYPDIHGFGFGNKDDDATFDEFLGVYGDNAYICVGALGFCATHVIDPLYAAVFYPAYKLMINDSGGSCVGMSATSLLIRAGDVSPGQFDSAALFAAGLTQRGNPAQWEYDSALGALTGPPDPKNLWAHIRKNHGTQISVELWGMALEQLVDSTDGYIQRRLNIIISNPTGYVLSMKNPDKALGGHVVVPYRVTGNRVWVYDNNDELDATRYVDFNTGSDTFTFPRPSKNETWNGSVLFTFPIDLWRGERTFPFDLVGTVTNLVFGDGDNTNGVTDALYSTPGGQWGWRADGTFVDTLPGARTLTLFGQTEGDAHTLPLFLPATGQPPTITINSRDSRYLLMSSQGGNIFQVQASNVVSGDHDVVSLGYASNTLTRMDVRPQHGSTRIVPKLGMVLGERQRLLLRWMGLSVPGGEQVGVKALRDQRGAEFVNQSSEDSQHFLIVDLVDGESSPVGTRKFGPLDVPAGAMLRATMADWPVGAQLRVELDVNSDGTFETNEILTGQPCASNDIDENGLPDACERPVTVYLPIVAK